MTENEKELLAALKSATSSLDHMLSKGVSGYWRKRWPHQYDAMANQLGHLRSIILKYESASTSDSV